MVRHFFFESANIIKASNGTRSTHGAKTKRKTRGDIHHKAKAQNKKHHTNTPKGNTPNNYTRT
jgi:hypothetical protein